MGCNAGATVTVGMMITLGGGLACLEPNTPGSSISVYCGLALMFYGFVEALCVNCENNAQDDAYNRQLSASKPTLLASTRAAQAAQPGDVELVSLEEGGAPSSLGSDS